MGCALSAASASAQTAFGSATTIVFPIASNTSTFTSTVTLYNPNLADVTVGLNYYDSIDAATPGPQPCVDVLVPANGSVEFMVPSKCTLGPGGHFGQLIVYDLAGTNPIFGFVRTQNNANAGFSVEGFPSDNFATDTTNSTGLKGNSTLPDSAVPYKSNCFVATLADPVSYTVRLFDAAGAQIGTDLTGSLNAFEEKRYNNIFANVPGVPAATDFANVRAEFTRTSAGTQQMIGFCTVQDNATFGADFRIAKALTPTPPPPPPGGMTLAGTFNGAIQAILADTGLYEFIGTTSLPLASTTTITVYGGGWFGKTSTGTGSIDLGVCYQDQNGPGPITLLGPTVNFVVTGAQTFHSVTATGSLAAATYTIGLCAHNAGTNSVNKNDNSSGFIFTTP